MKVCVTGGNGFIGSRAVRQLVADGHAVRCVLREKSDTQRLEGTAYERVRGDVRDAESMRSAVAGCDAIVHLASPSSWNDINSPLLEAVVEEGTSNVLAAARAAQAKVVFCSSITAIAASSQPVVFDETAEFNLTDRRLRYAHCKHAAELLCRKAAQEGQSVVIVNPGEVYGPDDTGFITAGNLVDIAKGSPVLVTRGGATVVYVDDVAAGIARALERGRSGERYILTGENLSIPELAKLTLRLLGLERPVWALPTPLIDAIARAGTALHIPLPFNASVIPYATRYWYMSNRKAVEELGVSFRGAEEALAPTLEWLKQAGHVKAAKA